MGWKISRNRRKTSVSPLRFGWEPLEVRTVPTAIIALIDSGVDLSNPTLSPYYDFTYAYNSYTKQTAAASGNSVVSGLTSHGTLVADFMVQGITTTKAQSGAGGADVKIMPIRAVNNSGGLDLYSVVRGIYWAADHGADVINLSHRANGEVRLIDPSDPHNGAYLSDAIKYAESMGAVVVTASAQGNGNIDLPGNVTFPVYADDPIYAHASPVPTNLMVAAGIDSSGNLTSISNWGPIHVDFGALANSLGETSYSAGYTSGVTAVIADLLPAGYAPSALVNVIKQTVTPKTQSVATNWSSTNGNINPAGAVASAVGQGPRIIAPVGMTASSAFSTGGNTASATKAIDGSGLSSALANGAAMPSSYPAHGNSFFDNWVSNGNGSAGTEWITVQLVGAAAPAVNIAGFHWWAYTADQPQRGIRTAMVSTSADGVNYSAAVPYTFYQGNNAADSGRDYALYATGVRYVKFSSLLNFGSDTYGSFVGLGEVRFITVPTPSPTIIAPVGATASSTFGTTSVAKAIDGSGLSSALANGAAMPSSYPAHGNSFFDNWVSNGNGSAGTEWITVQLVGAAAPAVNIAGFHWWAYTADQPQRGIRTAMVSTSADGVNYSAAVPYTFYQGNNAADSGRDYALYATGVRYVKFSSLLNFGSDTYGSFVGLGEVRFISAPS